MEPHTEDYYNASSSSATEDRTKNKAEQPKHTDRSHPDAGEQGKAFHKPGPEGTDSRNQNKTGGKDRSARDSRKKDASRSENKKHEGLSGFQIFCIGILFALLAIVRPFHRKK